VKRGLFVLALATVASSSFGATFFFFGVDPNTSIGDQFPVSAQSQRGWAAIAGSMSSISALTYERDPIGAGVTPYNPLPGVTISMTNVGGLSGVSATDQHELGWNVTPLGSKHLRFAPEFNANNAVISFRFTSLVNSFSTMYMGAQNNFPGEFTMAGFRNGNQLWSMSQSKPTPNDQLTSHSHNGFATDESALFFDEVRFISSGDRTNGSDHVGLDDTMFTYCNPVPEPATMAALGLGIAALLRRKRK
jgi:hypothetical protein